VSDTDARRTLKRVLKGLLIGAAAAAIIGHLTYHDTLEPLELKTLDLRFRSLRATPTAELPDDIVIVEIDQDSLEYVSSLINYQWPWPRSIYGAIIDFLTTAGADAVIFDMLFTEPDIERDISGAESDAGLVEATARSGRVIHTYVLKKAGLAPPEDEAAALLKVPGIDLVALPSAPPGVNHAAAALPSAALIAASRTLGFANVDPDDDNVVRRIPLMARLGDTTVMNAATAAAWDRGGRPELALLPNALQLGLTRIPTQPNRSFYLWWYRMPERQESPFVSTSAYAVLKAQTERVSGIDPSLDPDLFKDKIVYVGSSATGLFDVKASPLSRSVPGVQIQATALANLLRGDAVRRISRSTTLWLVLLLSLVTGCITHGTRHTTLGLLLTLIVLTALTVGSRFLLASRHCFIEIVPLVLGVALTFVGATLINYIAERRHSKLVRNIFEHYLDRSVVRTLINHPDQVKLGGERRIGTVLFSDVADFTNTSEKLEPQPLVAFMNLYLDAMTRIIIDEGGFVDKFVGDEIVAIFGAPNDLPDHAARACQAVVRMQQRVAELQPEFLALGCSSDIFFRAGLSTGALVVGNMGSEERMNYTAMGDVMNLGARLESANKRYDTRVLASDVTAAEAGAAYTFRPIDRVRVKGKDHAVPISEFVGATASLNAEQQARLAFFAAGYTHYGQQKWDSAEAAFQQAASQGDAPSAIFIARCQAFRTQPPPPDWDGSYTFTEK